MKKVSVLGSTGSIGKKTVDLLLKRKEEYQVETLSAHSNFALLAYQAKLLNARYVAISDERFYKDFKESLLGTNVKIEVSIIMTVCFIALLIDTYNDQLLPLLRHFLLIPYRNKCLCISY